MRWQLFSQRLLTTGHATHVYNCSRHSLLVLLPVLVKWVETYSCSECWQLFLMRVFVACIDYCSRYERWRLFSLQAVCRALHLDRGRHPANVPRELRAGAPHLHRRCVPLLRLHHLRYAGKHNVNQYQLYFWMSERRDTFLFYFLFWSMIISSLF